MTEYPHRSMLYIKFIVDGVNFILQNPPRPENVITKL